LLHRFRRASVDVFLPGWRHLEMNRHEWLRIHRILMSKRAALVSKSETESLVDDSESAPRRRKFLPFEGDRESAK
jgi:hypothetical protein